MLQFRWLLRMYSGIMNINCTLFLQNRAANSNEQLFIFVNSLFKIDNSTDFKKELLNMVNTITYISFISKMFCRGIYLEYKNVG